MKDINSKLLVYILRTVVFLTFLGHGMVALSSNPQWLGYLETVGFSIEKSKELIIFIGILDLIVAIIILLKPSKYIVLWAVIWAFSTALIRPLSGENIWSFIERGANWGAPLVLFFLLKNRNN